MCVEGPPIITMKDTQRICKKNTLSQTVKIFTPLFIDVKQNGSHVAGINRTPSPSFNLSFQRGTNILLIVGNLYRALCP